MEQEQKNTLQELEDAGSELPEILKRNTMRVPEGYFDHLEAAIIAQATAGAAPQEKRGRSLYMWMPIAAAACLLIVVGVIFYQKYSFSHSLPMQLAKMSDSELDAYIETQIASISSEDIYNYLSEEIHTIEVTDIIGSEMMSEMDAEEHFQESLHNQVYPMESLSQPEAPILDEKLLEDIDDALLQEYLNNAAIIDDMAL